MHAAAAGRDGFDLLNHVHPFNHFSEHAVTPALEAFVTEVQEVVVGHVDKELGGRRVWCLGTRHCQSAFGVFQAVAGFVTDLIFGVFLLHAWLKTTALDHKTVDHTVKDGVVVKAFAAVFKEVFYGSRGLIVKSFDDDIAMISLESNHFLILSGLQYLTVGAGSADKSPPLAADGFYITNCDSSSAMLHNGAGG
ncbi:Conserved hypothetical protein [Erwinia tasmaniensis Et1/99]|uniref:Uncharacterized protein n=1 Tax=Erwinia tasmaniensis (strain DSM 17950 / CFBP 7177 / CIP 109463 / NCPPB 4357 / Et1/99) TaxID=465817 RepID=B2VBD6_ERWT9|nr:Conserved hypothetical protein [Erwinia tasmaniensis Et1/99]